MSAYEFDLVVVGLDVEAHSAHLDAFDDRLDDITFGRSGAKVVAAVEREARSLGDAIRSAIADVESIPGVSVVRVEPDEHVSQSEIALRLGRTRQSVSQLVSHARGPGGFPPAAYECGHVALWRWTDVSRWAREAGLMASDGGEGSFAVIRAVNALLEARRAVARLNEEEQRSLGGLVAY